MNCVRCNSPIPPNSKFCLECGADLSDPGGGPRTTGVVQDLSVRLTKAVSDRYRISKMVGRGGMGAVFLAEDLTLERPVAIKVLPPEVADDDNLIARFEREARTAAKLDHPNIIPIFAVESAGGLHFFVMKFVSGEGLDTIMGKGRLTLDQSRNYLWEAARALGHAHQRGVVHRDIKPANIMLDHDGRIMLTDFGISKAMQSATQHTGTGNIIGTPHYMSPEQAKGEAVDGRSDQYSLAVVGFQMLTGRLPFADDSIHTVIYKHIFEDPPPIRDLNPEVPARMASAIHRALAKEPSHRFPTMEAFAKAICPDRRISSTSAPIVGGVTAASSAPTEITPGPAATMDPTVVAGATKRKRRSRVPMLLVSSMLFLGAGGVWAWSGGYLAAWGVPGPRVLAAGGDVAPDLADSAVAVIDSTQPPDSSAGDSTTTAAGSTAPATNATTEATSPPVQRTPDPTPRQPVTRRPARSQPPPQPVLPRVGTLRVDTDQYGTVLVDGVFVSETPVNDYELAPGEYTVTIRRDGCQEIVERIRITAGGRTNLGKKIFVCG